MIISPWDWRSKGQPVKIQGVEEIILDILGGANINNLALSGGIDSSLMLYFMTKIYGKDVNTFTIVLNGDHPDYIYSKMISEHFGVKWVAHIPTKLLDQQEDDCPGDEIVREFFEFVKSKGVDKIICCDRIDEYMCGYYAHQNNPTEETYFDFLRQLQENHLEPLNKNSGDIEIYLPYLNNRLILLLCQIPLSEKMDYYHRKKMMVEMAKGKMPDEIIQRPKYGFCDAMRIKN